MPNQRPDQESLCLGKKAANTEAWHYTRSKLSDVDKKFFEASCSRYYLANESEKVNR